MKTFEPKRENSLQQKWLRVGISAVVPTLLLAPASPQVAPLNLISSNQAEIFLTQNLPSDQRACTSSALVEAIEQISNPSTLQQIVQCDSASIQPLLRVLENDNRNPLTRRAAAKALGQIGSKEAIVALLKVAQRQDANIQASVLEAIAALNPQAQETVSALIFSLRDGNEVIRAMAAHALGQIGSKARRAIPALLKALDDPSSNVRVVAAHALGQINPDDARVIRALVKRTSSDSDSTVKESAAYALRQITPEAIPTLFEILTSKGCAREEMQLAQQLLLELGTAVNSSLTTDKIPSLLQASACFVRSEFYNIDKFIRYVFEELGADVTGPIVFALLEDPNEEVRIGAIMQLESRFLEAATPGLIRTFRNSKLYPLWKKENQPLVKAGWRVLFASSQDLEDEKALSQIFKVMDEDYLGYISGIRLYEGKFWEDLKYMSPEMTALFLEYIRSRTAATADSIALARSVRTYQASNKPAICKLSIARFLWRCR